MREADERFLTDTLRADPAVRFGFLFGSRANGRARADSDWDVAVYFDEDLNAAGRAARRLRLAAELERLGAVDVVSLNDADPLLAHRALGGRALVMADRAAYLRYFVRTMRLAEDQRYFDQIFARARTTRIREGNFGQP